ERLVKTCLAKDPDERWQSAHDVGVELRWVLEGGPGAAPTTTAWLPRALPWTVTALALAFAAFTLWASLRRPAVRASPVLLTAELGADVSLDRTDLGPAAILSPDGSLLALVARKSEGDRPQLYLRRLDQLQAVPLPGTEGAHSPFFSPDGQSIAFFADTQLKRVAVKGGAVVVLADAPMDRGGTWSEDGTIVFAPSWMASLGLSRGSSSGGSPEFLPRRDPAAGEVTHRWPQALPGGKALLFTAHKTNGNFDDASIVVQGLPSGPRKVIVRGGYHGRYLSSGHVVYVHEGTLFAIPFDLA